jgi:hypothetical protein
MLVTAGVFLQERYEVQIFNSYQNETPLYANGQTGSIYKQVIPMANASSKPGEWDVFDIYYTAPRFRDKVQLKNLPYYLWCTTGCYAKSFEIHGTIQYIGIQIRTA